MKKAEQARVRTATLEDVPRLVALLRATATAAQWTKEQFARMVEEAESGRVMLVIEAEEGAESTEAADEKQSPRFPRNDNRLKNHDHDRPREGEIVRVEGFAVAHRIGPECEIENIVVNPEQQRRGLGRNLLQELLNRVRRNACEAVFLEVRESNRAARGLYEKCGFREVGRRVKYYAQPQEDAVLYRYSINPVAS